MRALLDRRHRRGGVGRLPLDGTLGRRLLRRWVNVHGLGLRLHLRLHLDLHLRLHSTFTSGFTSVFAWASASAAALSIIAAVAIASW